MNLSLGLPLSGVDVALFIGFLLLNLFIGLSVGRKLVTIRDFAIGNKDFSTGAITATIVATWLSGGLVFYGLARSYTTGLHFVIAGLGIPLCLLLIGQVLSIRMGEFLNNLSVAEAMGNLYGKTVRFITAISGIVAQLGYVVIQFKVLGKVVALLTGGHTSLTILTILVVIVYASVGGIRSVTITDRFQFITLCLFIALLLLVVWRGIKDTQLSHTLSTNPLFSWKEVVGWNPTFISTLSLLLYFFMPGLDPSSFQRMVMARSVTQAQKAFTYAAGPAFLVPMLIAAIGILLWATNPSLDPDTLVNYVVEHYAFTGLKGLVVIGIAAMAMSTADSCLNSSAVLGIHDLMQVAFPSSKPTLAKLRLFSMGLGIGALYLSLYTTDILSVMLLAGSLYMPVVTVPLLFAIFGFRTSPKSVLIGMAAGFMTVAGFKLTQVAFDSLIPGMLANTLFLLASHYLFKQPGGWTGIKDKTPLRAARQKRKENWQNCIQSFKTLHLHQYLAKNLPAQGTPYFLLGLYVLAFTYGLFFTIPPEKVAAYQQLHDVTIYLVLLCVTGLLIYPSLPTNFRLKRFMTYLWPLVIGYVLFVVDTQIVLMGGLSIANLLIMLSNLMLVAIFLSPSLTLLIPIAGVLAGYLIFVLCYGAVPYDGVDGFKQFNLIYVLLVSITFLLSIFRVKRQKNKLALEKDHLALAYLEKKKELFQVMAYAEEVAKEVESNQYQFGEEVAGYIKEVVYHIKDYIRLEVSSVPIKKIIQAIKEQIKTEPFQEVPTLLVEIQTKKTTISVDEDKLKKLLVNAIVCIQRNNTTNTPIQVIIEDTTLGYTVSYMKDYTKQIAALRIVVTTQTDLPPLEAIYPAHAIPVAHGTTEENLMENLRIVDAHYGYAELSRPSMHIYVIPVQVRDVRAKVMELLLKPAVADPAELTHPVAIQTEQELWNNLANTTIDRSIIAKALDTIKQYHAGVQRKSGEPFFTHPIQVASILLTYCQDQEAVVAALLHDTVEDTRLSIANIKVLFGEQVAFLVGKVTNLEDHLHRLALADHENIQRLTDYGDRRALYVKLADRMHNMRTIASHSSLEKQKNIALETLSFFVPKAFDLGLTPIAEELKRLSLEVLATVDRAQ